MKTKPEDDLLQAVFAESAPDDVRAALLERTLVSARCRRRRRVGRVCGAAAFCVALLAAVFWQTREAASDRLTKNNMQFPSMPETDVPTVPGTSIRVIGDDELFAMFPDRPVALVGPLENQRFVFLDELHGARISGRASNDRDLKL